MISISIINVIIMKHLYARRKKLIVNGCYADIKYLLIQQKLTNNLYQL